MQNHYIIRKIAPFVSLCIKNLEKSIIIRYPYSTYALNIRVAHTPRLPVQYTRLGLSMGLCSARSHALEPFSLNILYSSG